MLMIVETRHHSFVKRVHQYKSAMLVRIELTEPFM